MKEVRPRLTRPEILIILHCMEKANYTIPYTSIKKLYEEVLNKLLKYEKMTKPKRMNHDN